MYTSAISTDPIASGANGPAGPDKAITDKNRNVPTSSVSSFAIRAMADRVLTPIDHPNAATDAPASRLAHPEVRHERKPQPRPHFRHPCGLELEPPGRRRSHRLEPRNRHPAVRRPRA